MNRRLHWIWFCKRNSSNLLQRLNEERGTTILLITHDLDIVAEAAHEMVVMQKGK